MRAVYSRRDADGTLRELFLPWWWSILTLVLRMHLQLTGCSPDDAQLERLVVRHGRWRITPPGH